MKKDDKNSAVMKKFKIAYAFALVLVIGGALTAKIASEKSLGNLKAPIENEYTLNISTTSKDSVRLTEHETVRNNVTGVPDTRDTEPVTEKSKYAVPYEDYYALPFGTQIVKDYSPEAPVYSKTMGDWRVHNGVDFAGEEGAQITSIAYGTVQSVYDDALLGTTVIIDHGNGVTALYSGFNKETVEIKKGTTVESGTLLGYLGAVPSEKDDGNHLHFEIKLNGKTTDPLKLMGK